jgi:hypothetical protein
MLRSLSMQWSGYGQNILLEHLLACFKLTACNNLTLCHNTSISSADAGYCSAAVGQGPQHWHRIAYQQRLTLTANMLPTLQVLANAVLLIASTLDQH